jgi:hypothetical protein
MPVAFELDDTLVKKMLANAQLIFLPEHKQRFLGAMIAVGQIGIMEGFVSKCAPDGSPWKPWSPTTEKIKDSRAAKGHSRGELMRDTSRLMNSPGRAKGRITMPSPGIPPAGDGLFQIGDDNATLASAVSYGPPLHFGDPGGAKVVQEYHHYKTKRGYRSSLKTRRTMKAVRDTTGTFYRNVITRPIPPRPWFAWRSDAGTMGVRILSNMITDLVQNGVTGG